MEWRTGMALIAFALAVAASPVAAAELKTTGRNVQYYTAANIEELDDVEGHVVGTYESSGVTFHDTGDISTHTAKGSFDHINGEGTQEGHVYRSFKDGSTTVVRYEGRARETDDGRIGEGTFHCVEGTGRFKGIQCSGTYRSIYLENDMTVTDWESTVILSDPAPSGGRD